MLKAVSLSVVMMIWIGLLVLSGCRNQEEFRDTAVFPAESTAESASVAAVTDSADSADFIPDGVLSQHGFVTLWTKRATEGPFHSCYFLPEGIFAITRPKPGSSSWRLIRYNLKDGLPMWFYDLDEPLKYSPVAYRYGPTPEGRKPDELFILQKDVIRCLDLQYGAEMWRIQLPFSVSCAPIVDELQYYIGSLDRRIYAMFKNKPFEVWNYITGGEVISPGTIGYGGQIYFTSTDKSVYRLEPNKGWVNGKSWFFNSGGRILGSPVFFSRWVFVGSTDFKLYCFEVDGTIAWQFPVEAAINSTPVVMSFRPDKPIVFCISQDKFRGQERKVLWAIDAQSGKELWHRQNIRQVVGIGRQAVYLIPEGSSGRQILAVDAVKGDEITSLSLGYFEFVPTNDADHGTNLKSRGILYLISKNGFMQAIQEKL